MVYQDPVQAVNPVLKIGQQVAECFEIVGHSKSAAQGPGPRRRSSRSASPTPTA